MKITILTDFEADNLEAAAKKLTMIQSISNDAVMLVETTNDLMLIHDLRQFGIRIKGACLGHVEKKPVSAANPLSEVN